MKINKIVFIGVGLILLSSYLFYTAKVYGIHKESYVLYSDIDLNMTINSETSNEELKEIKVMLSENGIDCEFSEILRNDQEQLLSIAINLSNNAGQNVSTMISNTMGIGEITFGRKNKQLFIDQNGDGIGNFAFFNMPNVQSFGFNTDSLMQNHFKGFSFNFHDFFDEDGSAFFGNIDSTSIDEIFEKMQSRLNSNNLLSSNQKFRFIDDPNTQKLIIIDGEESTFETLDRLSKNNEIEAVDFLKPQTAISVYGEKAKDGAIIVTTKK